ncbi:unnamed protein product, partial [Didymodactylos carnosus]
ASFELNKILSPKSKTIAKKHILSSISLNLSQPPIEFERINVNTINELNITETTTPYSTEHELEDHNMITGQLGEKFVYKYLLWKYREQSSIIKIEWLNEKQETYLPYDILIKKENEQIDYIEVKTTQLNDQHTFQISIDEIEHILKLPTYFIYRVYNINNPSICVVNNIKYNLQSTRQLGLQMTIKPVPLNQLSSE